MSDKKLAQQLEGLRLAAAENIKEILGSGKLSAGQEAAWRRMLFNIRNVVIEVDPAKRSLAEGISYRIEGEHVIQSVIGKGVVEYIHLPKELLFREGKLALQGITTLFHEWAHNPLRFSGVRNPGAREILEEQLADALAVNLGIKMRLPPQALFEHVIGRLPFIGRGPYRRYLQEIRGYARRAHYRETRLGTAARARILENMLRLRREAARRAAKRRQRLPYLFAQRPKPRARPGLPAGARKRLKAA